jgi:DNA-binding NarL/FixJ family response regulator
VTRCLVADDHPAVLQALVQVLEEEGYDVVAAVHRGDDALTQIVSLRPDVAVVDARMPGMSGIEVARGALSDAPDTAIVVYTGAADRSLLLDAADAGARGYVLKDAPLHDLLQALRTVADGGTFVDGALASTVLRGAAIEALPQLTVRERQVLADLADGRGYDEIGARLGISPSTVRAHVRTSMRRLEASTKTQAVAAALRLSLIA